MQNDARQLLSSYCRDGDQPAFNRFYRQHADRLWRFLVARGCQREAAYDIVAEAFLRFIQAICADLRSPTGLLYRIAINLQIDALRRAAASPVIVDGELAEAEAGTSAASMTEEEHVRRMVRRLPEGEQNLLLLRYWIGLTHKEIAKVLDLPEGTVRRRCSELLAELRGRWQAGEGSGG